MHFKPAVFLAVAAPLIPEVFVSGNTSPSTFFGPAAVVLFVAYAPAIVLIRELAVRLRLQVIALPLFGLAYGLLNEGILAHTLTTRKLDVLTTFAAYPPRHGLHLEWAAFIVPWHALFSVTLPILLVHRLVPERAKDPWLGRRATTALAVLTAALLPFYFVLGSDQAPSPVDIFVVQIAAMACAGAAAVGLGRRPPAACAAAKRPSTIRSVVVAALVGFVAFSAAFAAPAAGVPSSISIGATGLVVLAVLRTMSGPATADQGLLLARLVGASLAMSGLSMVIVPSLAPPTYAIACAWFVATRLRGPLPQAQDTA